MTQDSSVRPVVLTVAALDPCGGAGILADIKTFEQHRTLGMGVLTALTAQTENKFFFFKSLSWEEIEVQLTPLMERYDIRFVKIGMMEHRYLLPLITQLKKFSKSVTILWDPVLKTTTGFAMNMLSAEEYIKILKEINFFVPNYPEFATMSQLLGKNAEDISRLTCLIIKGGHAYPKGEDVLYQNGSKVKIFPPAEILSGDKRGTGCIFSSSLLSHLAWGCSIEEAIAGAKKYIEKILKSNQGLLAYHAA